MSKKLSATQVENLRAGFRTFDKDSSGGITKEEFTKAMAASQLTEAEIKEFQTNFFAKCDADGDGKVSWEEFLKANS